MQESTKRKYKLLLSTIGLAAIIFMTIQVMTVTEYNSKTHSSFGQDKRAEAYVDIQHRMDNASTWIKKDFVMKNGETVDLTGAIFDGVVGKNTSTDISEWTLRMEMQKNCYLNSAWCGVVEIHQNVGTAAEKSQTLDLRKCSRDEITLDLVDDPDIMIPLKVGDYIVYYPSESAREMPVVTSGEVTIGIILYYLDDYLPSAYEMDYYFHRNYTDGLWFCVSFIFLIAWIICMGSYFMYSYVYKKAAKEMELKKSGIACMSGIYSIIYIVDLIRDKLTLVSTDEESEKLRPADLGADEQLANLVEWDSTEAYKELIKEFVDLATVAERMKNRESLACEYISKTYGWCRIRFIAMDRVKDAPLEKVLFTIQQINEEKQEIDEIEGRVKKAESESKAKSTFLANMSHEIRTPINTVLGLDTMILRESNEDNVRAYARDIKNAGNMLLSLINSILDFSKLEAGKMELVPATYSLKGLIFDVRSIIKTKIESKNLSFDIIVAENIPDKLYGDDVRLKQILINLLTNAAKYTDKGGVTLSMYGKILDDGKIHLLVSVKDTGIGLKPEDKKKLSERFSRFDVNKNRNVEGTGIGMNLVSGLLELMNSSLKVASIYGQGSDFYFEIEQQIMDAAPIGKVEWDKAEVRDDEEYEASFTAPNAHILVVDDNDLNLMVFKNLLKETGVNIDTASSGFAALEMTAGKKYDIIFMDHMMPEMDGPETFARIKSQDGGLNNDTPEIVLTANALQGAREEYLKTGFTDFLAKPIQPELLEEMIMENLPDNLYKKGSAAGKGRKRKKEGTGLPELEGLDMAYALEHVGSADGVIKVMKQFAAVADSDAGELLGYYEKIKATPADKDAVNDYRIKVHAMKTSAGLFGALGLYGSAFSLECAARDENTAAIVDITPYFLDFWGKVKANVKDYFDRFENNDSEKKAYDKEKLESLLHQLVTGMKAYDIKSADKLLEEIEKYELDSSGTEAVDRLKTAVANLDVEGCEKICESLLK